MNRNQFNETLKKLESLRVTKEVLQLVLTDHTNAEIAKLRGKSEGTIRKQVSNLYKKFGIESQFPGGTSSQRLELKALFEQYKPEWVSDLPSAVKNEVLVEQTAKVAEQEEAIAKPHQESGEAVDASVRELNAKRGVDYDRLRNLLAIGKWREADEETRSFILCLVRREIEGSLRAQDINKLPSQDLQTIDKLWMKYSGGRFGFSVQKRLWQDVVGSRSNPGYGTLRRFGERVGWYVKGSWLSWSNLSFSVDSAPIGYLPTTSFIIYGNRLLNSAASLESFFEVEAEHGSGLNVSLFFSRVETCKL
jgi:predicted transcriptional regulator